MTPLITAKISENRVQIIDILPEMIADEFKSRAPITHLVCSAWLEKPDGVTKVVPLETYPHIFVLPKF